MNIVFGGQIARAPVLKALRAIEGIRLTEVDQVEDVVPHVGTADALVIANPRGNKGAALAAALSRPSSSVRWVQVVSAGADGLVSHGIPRSIQVSNQGGAAAPAVAEHAMALLLALSRRIDLVSADTARRVWNAELKSQMRSLEGSRLGIVGFGNIGRQLALRAGAFGMDIVGFSRSGAAQAEAHRMHRLDELPEKVGELDAMAICLALVPETRHLVDDALLRNCKPSCLLVNVSRGEIVASDALEAALREGRLAGAGLDVTEPEPLPEAASLWTAPNLIISPHIAATGNRQVGARIAAVVTENVNRFLRGEPPLNRLLF